MCNKKGLSVGLFATVAKMQRNLDLKTTDDLEMKHFAMLEDPVKNGKRALLKQEANTQHGRIKGSRFEVLLNH